MQRLRKQKPLERAAGILLPISSLPSPYGIGTLGSSAYAFIDFCTARGNGTGRSSQWGPLAMETAIKAFGLCGNPYFIDLDMLVEEGILDKKTIESEDWGDDPERIDYAKLYKARFRVLRQAFDRWQPKGSDYEAFVAKNAHWLEDYCLYMAIKLEQGEKLAGMARRVADGRQSCARPLAGTA
ncbi:MAG: 4-alpha-glucanotransferase [Clostridia bacterium]